MDGGDKCDDGLSCADIPLKETCHRMRLFHIFEDLEEDDFLFVRQSKGDSRYDLFYQISVEWHLWSESLTRTSSIMFFRDSHHLKLEELSVSELTFCSFESLYT